MSKTPVCDFLKKYRDNSLRFHMPGHKGAEGIEKDDITEIDGADVLYAPRGVILESEKTASKIFGSKATFYSTEGSSLSIRATVYLTAAYAKSLGKDCKIAAVRNVHASFVSACALNGVDPVWVYGDNDSLISCTPDLIFLKELLQREKPTALYLTSPDYLGNRSDIGQISKICHDENVLLIVDNAHGAYLKFTSEKSHPLDLGADISIDSAHKTLPCLTGTAYLHFGKTAPDFFVENANFALNLFASTSPSYLLISSLDAFNGKAECFKNEVEKSSIAVAAVKSRLENNGYTLVGDEPLKITLSTKSYGYSGDEMATILKEKGIYAEFYDDDYITFMIAPANGEEALNFLASSLLSIPKKKPITKKPPKAVVGVKALSIRDAAFSNFEEVAITNSEGKILAGLTLSCPPAIPILICGEVITKETISCFNYYGIEKVKIVKARL